MPVASMTGFARWDGEVRNTALVWELRSVNGKGLDLRLRLPAGFEAIEAELRRAASTGLVRGNIQASLQVARGSGPALPQLNAALLDHLLEISRELVAGGHAAPPSADGLLALRGVMETTEDGAKPEADVLAGVVSGFAVALDGLLAARAGEGTAIAAVLEKRLDEVEALIERAERDEARSPAVIRDRLAAQLRLLLDAGTKLDESRLAQEAALLATRADIREELDRLTAHVAAARALLASGGAIGRRLDFLSQEFNRESNTLCAKSNAASLTAIGLELKVVVDQFREQVQNIE